MFLAELIGFAVLDRHGRRYRLVDLGIEVASSPEPVVRQLHLRTGSLTRRVVAVEASEVQRVDVWARTVTIGDDPARDAPEVQPDPRRPARGRAPLVRLKQDLLDALVIDVESRRATRINDLWLDADENGIRLVAADLSVRGMLRRVSRGRLYRRPRERDLVAWEWIESFRGDLVSARAAGDRHDRLQLLPVAEVARLAEALPYPMTVEVVGLLPPDLAADVLEGLTVPRQLQVLESLPLPGQAELLSRVSASSAAEDISDFDPVTAAAILAALPSERRELVVELLRYPRDSVGAVMTNEIATVSAELTVGEALASLRAVLREPDFVYLVYVVEDDGLVGVVTLRELLVADPATPIAEVMNPHLETVHALDPAAEAAERLLDAQLLALPVVGVEGRLLGALTIDASVRLVGAGAWQRQAPRVFS